MIKKLLISIVAVLLIMAVTIYFGNFQKGTKNLQKKKELIALKLTHKGYSGYIIISEKRIKWFNDLLANSISNSFHLKGKAVDYWIMDLNNDGNWDKQDVDLMVKTIKEVEAENPEISGWTATYFNSGKLTKRMVHTGVK